MAATAPLTPGGGNADAERQLARLIGLRPRPGSKASFRIGSGVFGGDFLDLHAARGRSHEDRLALHAVEHDAEVQFAFDGQRFFDQQPLHDAAFRVRSGG